MKKIALWASLGLLLSLFLLSGCALKEYQTNQWQEVELPSPPKDSMEVPNTDSVPVRRINAELFLRSADGAMLVPVTHRMSVDYTQDAALLLMEALIAADEEGLVNPIPAGTRVLNLEHSGNTVTVDLSIDAYNVEAQRDLLVMDAAIAGTLGSLEDIDYVNLLIGGRKYSINDLTMGALPTKDADLTMLWTRVSTEADYIDKGDGSYLLSRSAVVYYPALTGGGLLPVTVPVSCTKDAAVDALFAALSALPDGVRGARAAYAFEPDYSAAAVVTEDGRRVLKISFSQDTWAALEPQDPGMTCAATALTLTSFLPEVDGVAFCAGDMLITQFDLDGELLSPTTGVVTRESLRSRIGTAVELYYATQDGSALRRVTRVLSPMVEHYPRMLLSMLLEGPAEADAAANAVPEGIVIEDIPGIMLRDNVMQLNLSANFYRLCQSLDADAERCLVYSIVNTLCNLDGVDAVQFYVEGEQAQLLSENISICVPLMPNPGLAADDSIEEETDL